MGKPVESYKPEFEALLKRAIELAGGRKERVFVVSIPDYGYTPFGQPKQESISHAIDEFNNANREITLRYGIRYYNITGLTRKGLDQPDLVAAIPSSLLSQMLIATLSRLSTYVNSGWITVFAGLEDGAVKITLTGSLATTREKPSGTELVRDIIAPEGTSIAARTVDDNVFVWISLPSVGTISVLVVDDNPDMAAFYRRSTEGTTYRIVHITDGQQLSEALQSTNPAIIVLDVLLPDINGWEILMHLRTNPTTCHIPVIVCTVAREEELALSLGAALYLPKPVRAREFIQALDHISSRVSTESARSRASTEALCSVEDRHPRRREGTDSAEADPPGHGPIPER